jgi:hypothetical protein
MKTRLLIIIGIITSVGISAFILHEMFDPVFSESLGLYDTCNLISGQNNTFYVFEDCRMDAFKPVKPSAIILSMNLNQKMQDAVKIRDACIPVSKFDVGETKGVLTIYFTEENKSKYIEDIDKIISIPYVIKTTEKQPSGATNPLRNTGCYIQNFFNK